MKKIVQVLMFLSVIIFNNVRAELILMASKTESSDSAYGQSEVGGDASYWMKTSSIAEGPELVFYSFTAGGLDALKSLSLPFSPMLMAPMYTSDKSKDVLIAYTDFKGELHVSLVDEKLTHIKKSVNVMPTMLSLEVIATRDGYAIGGISKEGFPTITTLDRHLAKQWQIDIPKKTQGEISSLFNDGDRIFAVSNHQDATGYVHEFSRSGVLLASLKLRGGGATGIVLKNRGFAFSYRIGKEVFVEQFDRQLKSVWTQELHTVAGGNTRKSRLHDTKEGVAWVGANNRQLMVYRFDQTGKKVSMSVDSSSGYGVPSTGMYSSVLLGKEIHIRGQARKTDGSGGGSIDSIYFIERDSSQPQRANVR